MNYRNFIWSEIRDRTFQKGVDKAIWNFLMFPFTLLINFISYQKWLKLLNKIGLDISDLEERVEINVKVEKVSFKEKLKKFGETQSSFRMNECYLLFKEDKLFIFPYHKPRTSNHFYTEILDPIILSCSNSKHPYQTLWKIPVLNSIQQITYGESKTIIDLIDESFNNKIQFKFNKNLQVLKAQTASS